MKVDTELLILVAVCSLIGLMGSFFWFFDLFNHFRVQALVVGFIFLIPALLSKKKFDIIIVILLIALNGGLILEKLYSFGVLTPQPVIQNTDQLKLLSINLLTQNKNHDDVLSLIKDNEPDVIVALELGSEWKEAFLSLEETYPHKFAKSRNDNFGIGIYSKRPFKGTVEYIGDHAAPIILAEFSDFILIGAHPTPPVGGKFAQQLNDYIARISSISSAETSPVILAGDFNATLWSTTLNALIDSGFRTANRKGLAWTWSTSWIRLPFAMQIDHIFLRGANVEKFQVLQHIGSDHFPIMADILIPQKIKSIQ